MSILVTGGAGFIGSHTVVELMNAGYDVVIVDNLVNASEKSIERIEQIVGKKVKFYKVDINDRDGLNEVFDKEQIDSCIHFAARANVFLCCPTATFPLMVQFFVWLQERQHRVKRQGSGNFRGDGSRRNTCKDL